MNRDYSRHQQKIIQRYYDNRDDTDRQRLGELATELYLSSGKKLDKLWTSCEEVMRRIKVPESRVLHILAQRDPALVAEVVKDVESGKITGK